MNNLKLDLKSKIPIYIQIRDQLKLKISIGEIKQGDKMMPVRDLAQELLINPNTVAKAYHELERDGLILTQRGMGTYVSVKSEQLSDSHMSTEADRVLRTMVTSLLDLGLSPEDIRLRVNEILNG